MRIINSNGFLKPVADKTFYEFKEKTWTKEAKEAHRKKYNIPRTIPKEENLRRIEVGLNKLQEKREKKELAKELAIQKEKEKKKAKREKKALIEKEKREKMIAKHESKYIEIEEEAEEPLENFMG